MEKQAYPDMSFINSKRSISRALYNYVASFGVVALDSGCVIVYYVLQSLIPRLWACYMFQVTVT